MKVLVVPAAQAEDARRELHRRGLVDRTVRMAKRGGEVLIPVTRAPPSDGLPDAAHVEDVDGLIPRPRPRDPSAELLERLRRYRVPPGLAPAKWERFEDVVVVRLSEAAREYREAIGTAFAETLGARCVVEDLSGIHGTLRTPEVRVIWGRGMEVVHLEGGVRYMFDVAKIMFSSGNLPERTTIATKVPDGFVVVDLFAGIGYFSLPIAVHARAERIYACELNPIAYHYLVENIRLNHVSNLLPLLGDCRDTAPRGVADVVVMGHFDAAGYLDVAFRSLRGAGHMVYHELCPKEQFPQTPVAHVTDAARSHWYDVESVHSRVVKSYAPGIVHAIVEARVRRRPRDKMSP
jgi:tRNA wybutosine-synthesizing protein 2